MVEELSCLNYYSSGFKLDKISYTLKGNTKPEIKTENKNKEEVHTA